MTSYETPTVALRTSVAPGPTSAFYREILDAQNAARARYNEPPLKWNPELAEHASWWAQELARMNQLVHAPREGRGIERENVQEGLAGWAPMRFVYDWLAEEKHFRRGNFPNVCDGPWTLCAHWTQIIWHGTTDVGCAVAHSVIGRAAEIGTRAWLVCRYSPGGNKDGQPVGMTIPIEYAEQPNLPPAEVVIRSELLDAVLGATNGGEIDCDAGLSGFVGGGVGLCRVDINNLRWFANQAPIDQESLVDEILSNVPQFGETSVEQPVLGPPELYNPPPSEWLNPM